MGADNEKKLIQLHWIGRFGNRMFQYAFGSQLAHDNDIMFYFPSEWEGSTLFKPYSKAKPLLNNLGTCVNTASSQTKEAFQKCLDEYNSSSKDNVVFVDFHHDDTSKAKDISMAFDDLSMMYFKRHFDLLCPGFLKEEVFQFSDLVKGSEMYQDLEKKKHTFVVIHVRRGDIVAPGYNGGHSVVTMNSYKKIIDELKLDESEIIWISDDPSIVTKHKWYCKNCDQGWSYPTGQHKTDDSTFFDFFPDFLTTHFARIIIRANSSFSWWSAHLSDGIVYSPKVPDRADNITGPYWVECKFVQGNAPHFMGSRYDDITVPVCTIWKRSSTTHLKHISGVEMKSAKFCMIDVDNNIFMHDVQELRKNDSMYVLLIVVIILCLFLLFYKISMSKSKSKLYA